MTSAEQVRNVLLESSHELDIEAQDDGSAVVRDRSAGAAGADHTQGFPVSETLYRCADLLADSGFMIALVRDKDGVYLNAQ
jgi:hypothetical protein